MKYFFMFFAGFWLLWLIWYLTGGPLRDDVKFVGPNGPIIENN